MKPEDVPAELVDKMLLRSGARLTETAKKVARGYLAAVLPAHERIVREQVATEIEQELKAEDDGSSWGGGMAYAVEVARKGRP